MKRIEQFIRNLFEGIVETTFHYIFDEYPAIFFTCLITAVALWIAADIYFKYTK